ncbi:hypothetical protein PCANC_26420 [Puccinia coronata f. sp. avenae]|uniref:Uncharacterized protein n=1 Tax=Puccinia coronata f. sp. avenae TaxID=200324 RepID=A0A2N5TNQ9_9BASI|nr:hypothetical protein PCANC_26420 [Puccinia coronata f. sp. avenae]
MAKEGATPCLACGPPITPSSPLHCLSPPESSQHLPAHSQPFPALPTAQQVAPAPPGVSFSPPTTPSTFLTCPRPPECSQLPPSFPEASKSSQSHSTHFQLLPASPKAHQALPTPP